MDVQTYDHQIYRYLDGGDSLHSIKDDECNVAYRLSRKLAEFPKLEICYRFLEKQRQLSAEAYHTGRESRVVTTLTLLKPHLSWCVDVFIDILENTFSDFAFACLDTKVFEGVRGSIPGMEPRLPRGKGRMGSEDYDTEDYDDYVEAQDDV
ncbi:hypothetical protein Tco_1212134 [Tanacetum coccineum]